VVGVEEWAEVRRMHRVEGLSGREISRRTGLARDTVARLWAAPAPPRYERGPAGSKVDPFKAWICEQLAADPRIQPQRLREMASELGMSAGSRSLMTSCGRRGRGFCGLERSSGRSIGRASLCGAICASRGS
jgi:transposase